jgi:hypothetical protein
VDRETLWIVILGLRRWHLYRATPAVTRGLGLWQGRGTEDLLQSGSPQIDWLIDWLIIYGFTSRSRIFHLYGDVTITSEGLQNLGLRTALRAFEQGEIFIVRHLLWQETSGFSGLIRTRTLLRQTRGCGESILTWILTGSHSIASYDTQGDMEDLYNPDPHG